MSTHSSIAILLKDGSVKSIYCHFDGFLSHVGSILLGHYNEYDKAEELISLGYLSSLDVHPNPLPEAPESGFSGMGRPRILLAEEHSRYQSQEGVTVAFHRDCGDDFIQNVYVSLDDYNKNAKLRSYNYLYKEDGWFIMKGDTEDWRQRCEWIKLTKDMIK